MWRADILCWFPDLFTSMERQNVFSIRNFPKFPLKNQEDINGFLK